MNPERVTAPPFFSIGITTYNRHALLREAINSVLSQSFSDFEIIVGNDYQAEVLTCEMLGINDPRVRIINHPVNLREVGNMNALLAAATGRYFTWLFDDDLYEPGFLQTGYSALVSAHYPSVLFSAFRVLRNGQPYQPRSYVNSDVVQMTGREFIHRYRAENPYLASTCGLFDRVLLLEQVGGVLELCPSAIGVYCEYLLLAQCALLDRILYVNVPYYVFRIHEGSWSDSNDDLHRYSEAGRALLHRCSQLFCHPSLVMDYRHNILNMCHQHLVTVAYRVARCEVARKRLGLCGFWRAVTYHWHEFRHAIVCIRQKEGIGISALQMEVFCLLIILQQFAYYNYVTFKEKLLFKRSLHEDSH